jgi:hypothetical protein
MKHSLFAMALATTTVSAFAADVGVSVSVGQPGFYGRIDIGNVPPPRLIFAEPIVIQQIDVVQQPIYLHVPPGHEKNWRKHCHKYNACGQPVYFVQDRWYNEEYVPRYRESYGGSRDERVGDNRGEGRDHGHGNGKGHKDD